MSQGCRLDAGVPAVQASGPEPGSPAPAPCKAERSQEHLSPVPARRKEPRGGS